jgi:lipoprotein-releasing system permease protein
MAGITMFGAFERAVAGRYLRARRGERFVSVIAIFSLIGIALGVATLIIVMSVMNGDNYQDIVHRISAVPGVSSAAPIIEGQVLLSAGHYSAGGLIRGMSRSDLLGLHEISGNIRVGSLDDFTGDDAIVIGTTLAMRASLQIGSRLTLVSPNGAATAFGTMPRVRAYRVVAIFDAGVNDYNASYAFLPIGAAQIFFQMPQAVSLIQVMTRDADHVRAVSRRVREALPDADLRVLDWTQSNNAFFGAVQVEQNVMFLILALIILVAAFNVVSSLIMMVKDKTRDIAVLRTIGAGRGAIMRVFLMCGASVGVTGTFLGTVVGIVFCLNIEAIRQWLQAITGTNLFNPEVYYLEHLPAKLEWPEVIQVIAMALVLSLLATLYPSWRAAQTDPVEALRHE